jgi:hypothetical protein
MCLDCLAYALTVLYVPYSQVVNKDGQERVMFQLLTKKSEKGTPFLGLCFERQGHNLAETVLYVP